MHIPPRSDCVTTTALLSAHRALRILPSILFVAALLSGFAGAQTQPANNQRPPNTQPQSQAGAGNMFDVAPPLFDLENAYLHWPLPVSEKVYGAIDGTRIKKYAEDVAAIAREGKTDGVQYWGRIPGTKYDQETQQYVAAKFREFGLQDIDAQELPLTPQWMAKSWSLSFSQGSQQVPLTATFPMGRSPSTPSGGIDLLLIWVGLGTAADFAGRDVRGKAVVIYSIPEPSVFTQSATLTDSLRRAQQNGAAAILVSLAIPGNVTAQMNSNVPLTVPGFCIGMEDGSKLRAAIEAAPEGSVPKVHIALDAGMVDGLKSANVWGTLPGMTDENILVISHMDSYFEGAADNASGVATMLSLAEFYSKIPKSQRKRTITFVGTGAHHAGSPGTAWMHENMQPFFAKTALILNCEHTAETEIYFWGRPPVVRKSTSSSGVRMFAINGGHQLDEVIVKAFQTFGVGTLAEPEVNAPGDMSHIFRDAPALQTINIPVQYHTDMDTPSLIPAPGLESVARAYAKIIDEVNHLDLKSLKADSPVHGM
jgi:Peptidase family M28